MSRYRNKLISLSAFSLLLVSILTLISIFDRYYVKPKIIDIVDRELLNVEVVVLQEISELLRLFVDKKYSENSKSELKSLALTNNSKIENIQFNDDFEVHNYFDSGQVKCKISDIEYDLKDIWIDLFSDNETYLAKLILNYLHDYNNLKISNNQVSLKADTTSQFILKRSHLLAISFVISFLVIKLYRFKPYQHVLYLYLIYHLGRFFPVFQPIVDQNGSTIGYEVLLRIRSFSGTWVYPDVFINLLEKNTFLMNKVLLKIVKQCIDDRLCSSQHFFSFNVTVKQVIDPYFSRAFIRLAEEFNHIKIEITEREGIDDEFVSSIKKYNERGIIVSLDDVMTGFNGLDKACLGVFDEVKIDKLLTQGIVENDKKRSVIISTISILDELGLKVVVEGVESIDQFLILKATNAYLFQGFLFGKPNNFQNRA
ncbi:EAL domain-containing protein [Vibrio sp. Isolate23]|uniref:EAL domain-containing protein n=1 Tax=Vibrio sp. Isolate23 TaxID=2908533 RepID=UPI001EFC7789|nr:EAL domain-containing protein [Vibrio sp. Isolate23]MCG9685209.1 EAL domain-containing protein [Vibrio sp. Isolate23]